MSAPVISFLTSSTVTGGPTPPNAVFNMATLGAMATVYDFGTIDTGSSGSTTWFWIFNNIAQAASISSAIISSSTTSLGLGHHESGSGGHNTEGTYSWSLQSGSLTGSVWVTGSWYVPSGASVYSSGAVSSGMNSATGFMYIYSGSSGNRLTGSSAFSKISGSADLGGTSGSGWLIGSYISVLSTTPQGSKTGSFCLKFQYT